MASLWAGLLLRIAKHWIAGETWEDAFARAQQSNTHKVRGILNLLGEEMTCREETIAATAEYLEILEALKHVKSKAAFP